MLTSLHKDSGSVALTAFTRDGLQIQAELFDVLLLDAAALQHPTISLPPEQKPSLYLNTSFYVRM